ncbi:sodium:solute symporter [Thiotrichales bacterium 19S3-7]|nr:sodium:solute symporter [Thiotrichales bacterium 19S3-7]MCF6802093.1 sodium:solute symporter [Thiotrichales bacterium 19S3-11]
MGIFNWVSFILLIVVVGLLTFRGQNKTLNTESYFVSNKKTALFALVATLVMTELNTSTLVGFASLGYSYGDSAVSLSLVFLFGLMFYAITVAKKWKAFDAVSVTTYFDYRYNKLIGLIAKVILTFAMIGFSANYIKSLTLIFLPVFPGLNEWLVSGVFCLIMTLITVRGGLRSIIQIDIFSFLITLVIFPFLYFLSAVSSKSHLFGDTTNTIHQSLPNSLLFSLIIITMFTYILAPWYGQKIFSAKSKKTALKAVILSSIIVAAVYALAILSAANLLNNADIHGHPQQAIPILIQYYLPNVFQGIAYAMLFFIAATTIVGLWNTIASVFIAHKVEEVQVTPLKYSILITLLISIFSYWLANVFIDQIFQKMVLMNIPISALAFSLLGGFYWKKVNSLASFTSIICGIIGGVFCYLYYGEPQYMWYWAVYVIPASFFVGILITLIIPKKVVCFSLKN